MGGAALIVPLISGREVGVLVVNVECKGGRAICLKFTVLTHPLFELVRIMGQMDMFPEPLLARPGVLDSGALGNKALEFTREMTCLMLILVLLCDEPLGAYPALDQGVL